MVTKKTKGYTKSKIDVYNLFMQMENKSVYKNPNEPLDAWIIRKSEEACKQK